MRIDQQNKELIDNSTKFKAYASLHPVCWIFAESTKGNSPRTFKEFPKKAFQAWSGAPVKVFIGARDDYDDRDSNTCADFVAQISKEEQRAVFFIL